VKPGYEFTVTLLAKPAVLQLHSFVSAQQVMYLKELTSDSQVDVVVCDFAQNYFFIL
jgi:hypothetical protein